MKTIFFLIAGTVFFGAISLPAVALESVESIVAREFERRLGRFATINRVINHGHVGAEQDSFYVSVISNLEGPDRFVVVADVELGNIVYAVSDFSMRTLHDTVDKIRIIFEAQRELLKGLYREVDRKYVGSSTASLVDRDGWTDASDYYLVKVPFYYDGTRDVKPTCYIVMFHGWGRSLILNAASTPGELNHLRRKIAEEEARIVSAVEHDQVEVDTRSYLGPESSSTVHVDVFPSEDWTDSSHVIANHIFDFSSSDQFGLLWKSTCE